MLRKTASILFILLPLLLRPHRCLLHLCERFTALAPFALAIIRRHRNSVPGPLKLRQPVPILFFFHHLRRNLHLPGSAAA